VIRWQPNRRQYRYLAVALVVLAAGGALALGGTTTASADVAVGDLNVAGANQTVDGDVSDVRLDTTLAYEHDVPDAERRIIRLKVGTSEDDPELLDYVQEDNPAGVGSGSVDLGGSVLEHPSLSADEFDPALAETNSKKLVIQAVIEVQRAGGDAVTHTVTDTATVTLHDGAELTVELGGDGSLTVETE
jgi:hypothetical protein